MDNITKTKLLVYCQEEDIEEVKKILLKAPSLVNLQDSYGCSLLMLALKQNTPELVKFLISLNANVNLANTVS